MLSAISSVLSNRVKTPIVTRYNKRLHPERKDKIAFVKAPEIKSTQLWEQVDPEQREALLDEITKKFLEGYDRVAINVGKAHLEGFVFTEFNSASNVASLLRRDEILHRLSRQTGRDIVFREGKKLFGENKICPNDYRDVWSDPAKIETYFVLLIDSRVLRRKKQK